MESSGAATTGAHKSSGKAPQALCPGGQRRSRGRFTGFWPERLLLMLRCAGRVGKCVIVSRTTQSCTPFFSPCKPRTVCAQDKPPSRLPPAGGEGAALFLAFKKSKKKQPATPALINSLPPLSHSSRQWVTCLGSVALNVFLSATLPLATECC